MNMKKETENYEWDCNSRIGEGTFGNIFKAKCKHAGQVVAVKCFKSNKADEKTELNKRDLLRLIRHNNIVKILACEKELSTNCEVLIMEYCSGENLKNIITKPENKNGLDNEEFLTVFFDVTKAMKHLRKNRIVHRDVKPSNIIKHRKDDGSLIYKLGDFGTVRQLTATEEFSTYCGSVYYMDPRVIGRLCLGIMTDVPDENVDLWSLGVTFFEISTGKKSFDFPNQVELYNFTIQKEYGIISASKVNGGVINKGSELPDCCRLTIIIRKFLCVLLSGLLETNPSRKWSYECYFAYAKKMKYIEDLKCLDPKSTAPDTINNKFREIEQHLIDSERDKISEPCSIAISEILLETYSERSKLFQDGDVMREETSDMLEVEIRSFEKLLKIASNYGITEVSNGLIISLIICKTKQWQLTKEFATKKVFEQISNLRKHYDHIWSKVKKESDRRAVLAELYTSLFQLTESFLEIKNAKLMKEDFSDLKKRVKSLIAWAEKNKNSATAEEIREKQIIVKELGWIAKTETKDRTNLDPYYLEIMKSGLELRATMISSTKGHLSQDGFRNFGEVLQIADENFTLDVDNLNRVFEPLASTPVIIISMVGESRVGKSFLLNNCLRHLLKLDETVWFTNDDFVSENGFWRHSTPESSSDGIWLWSMPLYADGVPYPILLMDTQNTFGDYGDFKLSTAMLTFSLLTSSITIYTVAGKLRITSVLPLYYSLKATQMSSGEEKALQKLLFLCRDWKFREYLFGFDGGDQHMNKFFQTETGEKEKKQKILESFSKISGFLMPYPGEKVALDEIQGVADIDERFLNQQRVLFKDLFTREYLQPLKVKGVVRSGKELISVMEDIVNNIASKHIKGND